MEDASLSLWGIAVMGGPLILAAVLGFGIWRQREGEVKSRQPGGKVGRRLKP